MASYSDDFNRSDGPLGANWTDDKNSFAIASNVARPQAGGDSNRSRYTGGTMDSADHYVQGDVSRPAEGATVECGILARYTHVSGSDWDGYLGYYYKEENDPSGYQLRKIDGGSETTLDTATGGDGEQTFKLIVDGSSQSLEVASVEECSATDPDITTGAYCGMQAYGTDGQVDNWSAEDLAAGPTQKSVAGVMIAAGVLNKKLMAKRTVMGII